MGLSDRRRLFFKIRATCQVFVKNHAFKDYPERGFSKSEVVRLIRTGVGRLEDNDSSEAIPDSNLFFTKDDLERQCKLVVLIEEVEVEDNSSGSGGTKKTTIIVCSAYREVGHET